MSPRDDTPDSPKNEFTSFVEDVAEEISQRVREIVTPDRRVPDAPPPVDDELRIFDWPAAADRIIEELR